MCNHEVAMSKLQNVERSVELPATPDVVWEAVTASEQLSAWFGAEVDLELRPGGPARFRGHDGAHRHGLVEEVDLGHRLTFRWWPLGAAGSDATRVNLTVEPAPGGGTILTIVEEPLAGEGGRPGSAMLVSSR
jgi:uncharacterized protein YndB with AHSA1/START domain